MFPLYKVQVVPGQPPFPQEERPVLNLLRGLGNDADDASTLQGAGKLAAHNLLERNQTIDQSDQAIVAGTHNILTGVELGSVLTQNNIARLSVLVTEDFDAEALGAAIAPKPGTTGRLFMCHDGKLGTIR
jgi:hypothetical protein